MAYARHTQVFWWEENGALETVGRLAGARAENKRVAGATKKPFWQLFELQEFFQFKQSVGRCLLAMGAPGLTSSTSPTTTPSRRPVGIFVRVDLQKSGIPFDVRDV